MIKNIYQSFKRIASFFLVLFFIGAILGIISNFKSKDIPYLQPGNDILLSQNVKISTSDIKLKNIILDRDKIVGEFDDGYYTENNNILLFSNDEKIIDDNTVSGIEFNLINNYFLNRESEKRDFFGNTLLIYRGEKNNLGNKLYVNIIYILLENNIVEILFIGDDIDSLEKDLENFISVLKA